MDWGNLLWCYFVYCKQLATAWDVSWNTGGKSRIFDKLLYYSGADSWAVFKKDLWLEYLGGGGDYRCGLVSALYGWRFVSAAFGSFGFPLCRRLL